MSRLATHTQFTVWLVAHCFFLLITIIHFTLTNNQDFLFLNNVGCACMCHSCFCYTVE